MDTLHWNQERTRGERERRLENKNTQDTQISLNKQTLGEPKVYLKLFEQTLYSAAVPIKKSLATGCTFFVRRVIPARKSEVYPFAWTRPRATTPSMRAKAFTRPFQDEPWTVSCAAVISSLSRPPLRDALKKKCSNCVWNSLVFSCLASMSGVVCVVCPFADDKKPKNIHVDLALLV